MANKVGNFLLLVAMSIFLITACTEEKKSFDEKIIQDIASPDKTVDVIITKYSYGGATGSIVYKLYLKKNNKDKSIAKLKPLLVAEKVGHIAVRWTSTSTLQLDIDSDRIIHFSNVWWDDRKRLNYYIKMRN